MAPSKNRGHRGSVAMFMDTVKSTMTRTKTTNLNKKKMSLSIWENFQSVDWQADAQREYDDKHKNILEDPTASRFDKLRYEIGSWFIPALVGVLTATSGCFIEKTVEWLGDLRSGYCPTNLFYSTREQCQQDWVQWSSPYAFYVLVSTALATLSATLTYVFAPMARGSGIPEIKTILGGMTMKDVLAGNTLIIKIIGLSLSVAAGLSCGKEGPLVHIACCWSNFVVSKVSRLKDNMAKQRELLSCACAAGVAVAFGAPLGGVLFSLEEASTLFPNRTMIRAFFAASVAAVTLAWWNPTGSGKLTMFEATYDEPPRFWEYGVFIVLGTVGGCVGALFVHFNVVVSKARAPGTWFRKKCHIIVEVFFIALMTAVTSFPLLYTNVLSNVTIRALFHNCADKTVSPHEYMLDMCTDDLMPRMDTALVGALLLAGFLRYVQMIFTFGTGAPAGLFIPSLYTGAVLGRVTGLLLQRANDAHQFADSVSPAGVYAMIGAAAVLGGVCRVTISLVVIMFELTSGLQLIVPFMLACLTSKWVGDYFTEGIYDYMIIIRKYPFLHEPNEVTFSMSAEQLMDEDVQCFNANAKLGKNGEPVEQTVGQLLAELKSTKYGGFPLTVSEEDFTLLGYVATEKTKAFLQKQLDAGKVEPTTYVCFKSYRDQMRMNQCCDLSECVNEGVLCVPPAIPAAQIHSMFRNLGIKVILVARRGNLVGLITKKSLIKHMAELEEEHHKPKPKAGGVGAREALLA